MAQLTPKNQTVLDSRLPPAWNRRVFLLIFIIEQNVDAVVWAAMLSSLRNIHDESYGRHLQTWNRFT